MKIENQLGSLVPYFTKSHKKLSKEYINICNKYFENICWPSYFSGLPTSKDGVYSTIYNLKRFKKKYQRNH